MVWPALALTLELPSTGTTQYAIEACNGVALCNTSAWSRALQSVGSAPTGGSVTLASLGGFLGAADAALEGSWTGFDAGGDLSALVYDACVGTTPLGCQLTDFTTAGIAGGDWSSSGLGLPPLQCGATYHLAVRATNCDGMAR